MTSNSDGVRGPMYIDATPLMVTADVKPLVAANVGELIDLLAGEFFDDFMEIADPPKSTTEHDGHAHQKLLHEDLKARLVERMSTKVALTGPQAMRTAGRMAKLAKPLAERSAQTAAVVMKTSRARLAAVPQQQDRRRSA